jgi:hypothetical protein
VQKALQLFDLMEKFIERARNPVAGQPLVYDPGDDDQPMLPVRIGDGGTAPFSAASGAAFFREAGVSPRTSRTLPKP